MTRECSISTILRQIQLFVLTALVASVFTVPSAWASDEETAKEMATFFVLRTV